MNSIKTIALCFMFATAFGQEGIVNYQSFVIENGDVLWAQVYHHEKSTEEVCQKLFNHLKTQSLD